MTSNFDHLIMIDTPVETKEDDKFLRHKFAQHITDLLLTDSANGGKRSSGIIVGLNGAWGSGKTSILNFIETECNKTDPIIIIKMNPWSVSGDADAIQLFFSLISDAIDERLISSTAMARDLKKVFARYAEAGGWLASVGTGLPGLGQLASALAKKDSIGVVKARKELQEKLEIAHIPIVILIDEIDRLEDDQIRSVMKLVKSILDFKSISCVLAYDFERVVDALGSGANSETKYARGVKYLEKIVTINVQVPLLYESERKERIFELIAARMPHYNLSGNIENNTELNNLLEILFDGMIKTPRDITRLITMFDFLVKSTSETVNWVDYLAYAALCIKCPHILNQIFDHPQELTAGELNTVDTGFDTKHMSYCDVEIAKRYNYIFNTRAESNLFAFMFDRFTFNLINNPNLDGRISKSANLAKIMRAGI